MGVIECEDDDVEDLPAQKPLVDFKSPITCATWDVHYGNRPGDECGRQLMKLWLADRAGNATEASEAADWLHAYHATVDFCGFEIGPVFTKSGRGPFTGFRKKTAGAA